MIASEAVEQIKPAKTKRANRQQPVQLCKVLALAPRAPRSQVTIDILRDLLAQAEAGELLGLAAVGMIRGGKHTMHVSGEAHRHMTLTRGMLKNLDDEIAFRLRHGQ